MSEMEALAWQRKKITDLYIAGDVQRLLNHSKSGYWYYANIHQDIISYTFSYLLSIPPQKFIEKFFDKANYVLTQYSITIAKRQFTTLATTNVASQLLNYSSSISDTILEDIYVDKTTEDDIEEGFYIYKHRGEYKTTEEINEYYLNEHPKPRKLKLLPKKSRATTPKKTIIKVKKIKHKKIVQLTKKGEYINTFNNSVDAAKSVKYKSTNDILRCCNKELKLVAQFVWLFESEYKQPGFQFDESTIKRKKRIYN